MAARSTGASRFLCGSSHFIFTIARRLDPIQLQWRTLEALFKYSFEFIATRIVSKNFLQIGQVDEVSAFAKSSSDRFTHLIDAQSLKSINQKLVQLLQSEPANGELGLEARITALWNCF